MSQAVRAMPVGNLSAVVSSCGRRLRSGGGGGGMKQRFEEET